MIIKFTVGLRVDEEDEFLGLDESQHGEKAYNL
jgi:ammonia channel protein AmtB